MMTTDEKRDVMTKLTAVYPDQDMNVCPKVHVNPTKQLLWYLWSSSRLRKHITGWWWEKRQREFIKPRWNEKEGKELKEIVVESKWFLSAAASVWSRRDVKYDQWQESAKSWSHDAMVTKTLTALKIKRESEQRRKKVCLLLHCCAGSHSPMSSL